jgi:hypothetical protein
MGIIRHCGVLLRILLRHAPEDEVTIPVEPDEDGEWPITPGEIESCNPCMSYVRTEEGKLDARSVTYKDLYAIHLILHRAPWESPYEPSHGPRRT